MGNLTNKAQWVDTSGNKIHAHGGCIQKFGDWYYWYGENRMDDIYVSCYRSKDLTIWEYRNNILTIHSKTEAVKYETDLMLVRDKDGDYGPVHELNLNRVDPFNKVNIERPKVVYNEKTKKYVMWAHFENGVNYSCARACVASCDTPDGDFVFHGSFSPLGNMSRDCTLFKDDDGTCYFISNARDNMDMMIYKLTEDYLSVEKVVNKIFVSQNREAPVVFKHNNLYYMLTSFCSGWEPNQCMYSYAKSLDGEWKQLEKCADEITYDTQPAFSITLDGGQILYFGDHWSGGEYFSSSYVVLPLEFYNDNSIDFKYVNSFNIENGKYLIKED